MAYFKRHIDEQLLSWKDSPRRKPLLIRGARQVGKSTAVRELGKLFRYFVEINLEKQPDLLQMFPENFGQFDHYDPEDDFEQRHVDIVPLYALSNLEKQQ